LSKRQQDVQGELAHRRRGVELLCDANKGGTVTIENVHNLREIGQRSGQSIDFVDYHNVDSPLRYIVHEACGTRTVHVATRISAIVVGSIDLLPTFMRLALDVGLTGLALRVERIESQFEALFRGFACTNGAAPVLLSHRWPRGKPE
jgi:hypothetical protein